MCPRFAGAPPRRCAILADRAKHACFNRGYVFAFLPPPTRGGAVVRCLQRKRIRTKSRPVGEDVDFLAMSPHVAVRVLFRQLCVCVYVCVCACVCLCVCASVGSFRGLPMHLSPFPLFFAFEPGDAVSVVAEGGLGRPFFAGQSRFRLGGTYPVKSASLPEVRLQGVCGVEGEWGGGGE